MRIRRTDPGGDQSEKILDALGRVIQTRVSGYSDQFVTQEQRYDFAGRMVFQSAPHLVGDNGQGSATFEYDRLGRLRFERRTDESAPAGVAVTQLRYGAASQVDPTQWTSSTKMNAIGMVQRTSPSGAVDLRGIGYFGQTVVSRDALGNITQQESGSFGLPTQIRDTAGNLTTFQHDRLGRRTAITDPDRGTEQISYDTYDAPQTTIDTAGGITTYFYDLFGQPLARNESGGTLTTYQFGWAGTKRGQLIEARTQNRDGTTTTLITYDYQPVTANGAGQVALVTRTIGSRSFETRMEYDSFGRLSTLTYPPAAGTAFAIRHVYDSHGHLTSVVDQTTGAPYWSLTSADQGYRIGREAFGDGTVTQSTYQPLAGRLTGIETRRQSDPTVLLQQLSYGYDGHDELAVRSDGVDPTRSRAYEHDLLGRLTRVVQQQGTGTATELERFAYNGLGNMTSRSSIGPYIYGSAKPHAVTAAGSNTYTYDARGNQLVRTGPSVAGGRQEVSYAPFDLPTRIVTGNGVSQSTTDYTYDADQRRAYMVTSEGTQTWYSGELYELEQTPTSFNHRYRVYGPSRVVAEIVRQQGAVGEPVTTPVQRYLHADGLGSPDLITDDAGAVVSRPLFEPFGNKAAGVADVVTGFTGHRQEAVGLIDMRGRFYDPALGRFLSPDPIVSDPFSSQALNRYSYVQNRPLRLTDPSGFDPISSPSQVDSGVSIEFCGFCGDHGYSLLIQVGPCAAGECGAQTVNHSADPNSPIHHGDGAPTGGRESTSAGTTGTGGSPSSAGSSGTGGTGGMGGSGGQSATAGVAIACSVAGLAVGAGVATATTYGLGALAAVCLPCAVGVGLGLAAISVYKLLDGGAKSIYDSGDHIVHGQGTGSDYFTIGSVIGGTAAGGASSRVFANGRATAGAMLAPRVVVPSPVWSLNPLVRGVAIENAIGRNLPGNYPVIDRFIGGIATSIKSLDLRAATYQRISKLSSTLTGYINDVAASTGVPRPGAVRISCPAA